MISRANRGTAPNGQATISALPQTVSTAAPGEAPAMLADRYWRSVCVLAACHLLGTTWPPPGTPQRTRVVGHWGCNPGIAWVAGHLASHWIGPQPLMMVVGTGHASSFCFAHRAIQTQASSAVISAASARYGQPGGDPSELIGHPNVPYVGGELGPALAVSQGLAAASAAPLVACVVGDGECETPAALAALAHADVLLRRGGTPWLPVINANGFRMGSSARFTPAELDQILVGFGYEVFQSNHDSAEASAAARNALTAIKEGHRAVWISVTEKGWPAPEFVNGYRYRGDAAHRAPPTMRTTGPDKSQIVEWFDAIGSSDLFSGSGLSDDRVGEMARRVVFATPPANSKPTVGGGKDSDRAPCLARNVDRVVRPGWSEPIVAVDEQLAARSTLIFSPDEAASNRMTRCLAAGHVVEVLAEETCAAWAWGSVEAGRPAVFATYEAFAPIAGSVLTQYVKMVHARPNRNIPPLIVLATSLSWANSPTHQNTDLTGALVARQLPNVAVVYPVGAQSAASRVAEIADTRSSGLALLLCSKQSLSDPPDPGGAVLRYKIAGGPPAAAILIAIGDVCVTEAVAAAAIAAGVGVGVEVLAVVDLNVAAETLKRIAAVVRDLPVVAATCCAPDYAARLLWGSLQRFFPIHGYHERWGATAWETLRANRLDRLSLLEALAHQGAELSQSPLERVRCHDVRHGTTTDLPGVIHFDSPDLEIVQNSV